MDANEAAEAIAAQEGEVKEEIATTTVEPEIEPEVLPSDEKEPTETPSVEELQKQIEGLEAKVKKGKDINSRRGQAEKEQRDADTLNDNLTDFYKDNLEDLMSGDMNEEGAERAKELGITDEQLELTVLRTEKSRNVVYDAAGGKEAYTEMIDVMKEVYSEKQKEAYSKGITDPQLAPLLVAGLKAEYAKQNTKEVNYSDSASTPSVGSRGYADRAGFAKDMAAMRRAPSSQQGKMQAMIDAKLGKSDSKLLMG